MLGDSGAVYIKNKALVEGSLIIKITVRDYRCIVSEQQAKSGTTPGLTMINEYLLCIKTVDVQDPHLLDNRTLSGFSSPFDKNNKWKENNVKQQQHKDVNTAQDWTVPVSLSLANEIGKSMSVVQSIALFKTCQKHYGQRATKYTPYRFVRWNILENIT